LAAAVWTGVVFEWNYVTETSTGEIGQIALAVVLAAIALLVFIVRQWRRQCPFSFAYSDTPPAAGEQPTSKSWTIRASGQQTKWVRVRGRYGAKLQTLTLRLVKPHLCWSNRTYVGSGGVRAGKAGVRISGIG
jgi:hypothetical protein